MANEFYQYQSPVNPGTTIRSNKYNSDQEAIETGFRMVQTKIAQSLKFTAGFTGTQLPQVVTDSMIWVSPTLGASLYPMSTFISDIQSAADNAAAAQLSQNNAAESESNAAASEESAGNSANAALSSEGTATSKAAIATTKAAEASDSASTATAKANTATTKAAEASASASTATTKANIATTKAAEASTSAAAALTSEANALASKNSASTSETNALASKNNAAASATSASNSAAAAEQARDEAQQIAGGDAPNALKLGGELPSFFTDIPSRLGYTPVRQGGGPGQLSNTIKIGWNGADGLLLQVDNTNFGYQWPITSNNTTKFNGQLASYYATAEALSDAGVGTTSKDIDVINTLNVGGGFYRNPPSSAPDNGSSHWHTVFMDRTGDKQGAVIQVRDSLSTQIPSMYFRQRGSDGLWAGAVEVQHSKNLATAAQIHSSLDYKAASAKAVKDFVNGFGLGLANTADTGNDIGDSISTGYSFAASPSDSPKGAGQGAWHVHTIGANGGFLVAKLVSDQVTNDLYFQGRSDFDFVKVCHSGDLATQADINNSVATKATSSKSVKDFVDSRLSKPAVKHYHFAGNINVNFNEAIKHVVTRFGSGNGTITLSGTVKAGDELVIVNVRDDSGTATITGKMMFTGVGGVGEETHTLTGQAKVTMFGFDGSGRLMIAEVV